MQPTFAIFHQFLEPFDGPLRSEDEPAIRTIRRGADPPTPQQRVDLAHLVISEGVVEHRHEDGLEARATVRPRGGEEVLVRVGRRRFRLQE